MGLLDWILGGSNEAVERELRFAENAGFDELEGLKNKEIRREKLANYEYYTEDGEEDL